MANKSSASAGGGIGIVGLLTIAFIVLKLTNVIAWPWVWVLSPIWLTASLVLAMFVGVILYVWIFGGHNPRPR